MVLESFPITLKKKKKMFVTTIKRKYPDYMYKISSESDGICRNYETLIANQLQIDDQVL